MQQYNIGNVRLENPLILAPMAGVNCAAFRLMCRENGAGLVSTPMIIAHDLANNPEQNLPRLSLTDKERPLSAQIVGSKAESMAEAARILSGQKGVDIIDINMGCPEEAILAMQAGAFFVKHPDQMQKVVRPVVANTNKPVMVKIRIGWDNKSINAVEVAKLLQDMGVSAIAVHGRTRKQKYSGVADWDIIRKVKEAVNIPVIGNGDIDKPGAARFRLQSGDCDMIMIGRAAMGNPFIFKRISYLLQKGQNPPETTQDERVRGIGRFIQLYEQLESRDKFSELKQHCLWFCQEFPGSRSLRDRIGKSKDLKQLRMALGRS